MIPLFIPRLLFFLPLSFWPHHSPHPFYLSCNPAFSLTFLSFHHFLSGFLGHLRGLGGAALGQTTFMLLLSRVPLRRASEMSISFSSLLTFLPLSEPLSSYTSSPPPPNAPCSRQKAPSHITTQTSNFHRTFFAPWSSSRSQPRCRRQASLINP